LAAFATQGKECADVLSDTGLCSEDDEYATNCCMCGGGAQNSIDGRYVDGVSITTNAEYGDGDRIHLFTLAAGASESVLSSDDADNFAAYAVSSNLGFEVFDKCWAANNDRLAPGCFLGNCRCHGAADLHDEFEAELGEENLFTPPSFVGGHTYCDSTVGANELYYGPWKDKLMFTSASSICVDGELKDESWWEAEGLQVRERVRGREPNSVTPRRPRGGVRDVSPRQPEILPASAADGQLADHFRPPQQPNPRPP
jgi:hypothetical protein